MHTDAAGEINRQWELQQLHELDFEVFREMRNQAPLFLDIGANAGQSAISFMVANPGARVISFEPNRLYSDALAHVGELIPRFDYHMTGCGESDGEFTLSVPVIDGQPYFQEASLDPAHFELQWVRDRLSAYGDELTFERVEVRVQPLDGFRFAPDAVKIDAEGWELSVLKGMIRTLEAHRPMLLIENNDYEHVTAFLAPLGYRPYWYNPSTKNVSLLDRATTNTLYLTRDHFGELHPRLTRIKQSGCWPRSS